MKKIIAAVLFVGAAFASIPFASAGTPLPSDTQPSAPVALDTRCCAACVAAGGICHGGPGTFCFCE